MIMSETCSTLMPFADTGSTNWTVALRDTLRDSLSVVGFCGSDYRLTLEAAAMLLSSC